MVDIETLCYIRFLRWELDINYNLRLSWSSRHQKMTPCIRNFGGKSCVSGIISGTSPLSRIQMSQPSVESWSLWSFIIMWISWARSLSVRALVPVKCGNRVNWCFCKFHKTFWRTLHPSAFWYHTRRHPDGVKVCLAWMCLEGTKRADSPSRTEVACWLRNNL